MKKLLSFFGGIIAIIIVLAGASSIIQHQTGSTSGPNSMTVFNAGDYIDPSLLKKFEAETGYKVNYETFDSNEAMYTKIEQGGTSYDIAVPSDYMIEKMIERGLVKKLDKSKLVGLDNIDPKFLDKSFDPGNTYSIPYFWGTVGIIYNDKMVERAPEKWDDIWSSDYRNNIMLIDGAREIMGMGLNAQGDSVNSKNIDELDRATAHLEALTPNIKAIVADEIKQYMIGDQAAIAVTYSGEAAEMLEGNDSLHYVVPREGSNLWFDNMVIPTSSKNTEAAYAFINFMLDPENAAQNAEYIGYATPNDKARDLLPDEVKNDREFYPDDDTMKNLEVYRDLGAKWLGIYNDKYLQFKMYRK